MACLAKDPDARPQSAAELARRLLQCDAAARWTTERRAAWWQAHRQMPVAPAIQAELPASSEMNKTVKIDMDERTP